MDIVREWHIAREDGKRVDIFPSEMERMMRPILEALPPDEVSLKKRARRFFRTVSDEVGHEYAVLLGLGNVPEGCLVESEDEIRNPSTYLERVFE